MGGKQDYYCVMMRFELLCNFWFSSNWKILRKWRMAVINSVTIWMRGLSNVITIIIIMSKQSIWCLKLLIKKHTQNVNSSWNITCFALHRATKSSSSGEEISKIKQNDLNDVFRQCRRWRNGIFCWCKIL